MNLKSFLMALSPEVVYTVYCQTIPGIKPIILNEFEVRERLSYKVLGIEVPDRQKVVITIQAPKIV